AARHPAAGRSHGDVVTLGPEDRRAGAESIVEEVPLGADLDVREPLLLGALVVLAVPTREGIVALAAAVRVRQPGARGHAGYAIGRIDAAVRSRLVDQAELAADGRLV